jgi:hypothetical protein
MSTYYCEPCRNKGRITKAVTRVGNAPMCSRHDDQESRSVVRVPLEDAPIVSPAIARPEGYSPAAAVRRVIDVPVASKVKLPEKIGEILVISMDDVPMRRTPKGVAEELVQQLQGLAVGKAVATRCQSAKLAETTVKNVRVHAKKLGMKIGATIKDGVAFMWVTEKTEVV